MKLTMRPVLMLTLAVVGLSSTAVQAECYGDAAAMYGCGASTKASRAMPRSGNLEHFGDSRAPVLPDLASSNDLATSSDVITPQERRRMLRSIVIGNRRTLSDRSYIQAINQSGRPLRRSGAVNQGGGGR